MNTPQIKRLQRHTVSVSGSLAYYQLLSGMTFTRSPVQINRQRTDNTHGLDSKSSASNTESANSSNN